jgi:hypothetical protein
MPKKLDRAGIVDVYETLGAIKSALDEPMHRFRAVAMRRQLKDLAESIIETRDEAGKKTPAKFNEEREKLVLEYTNRDANGKPIIDRGNYVIDPKIRVEFDKKFEKLRDLYKDDIKAYDDAVLKTNDWLLEEIEMPEIKERLALSWFNKSVGQDHLETLYEFIVNDVEIEEPVADAAGLPEQSKSMEDAKKALDKPAKKAGQK